MILKCSQQFLSCFSKHRYVPSACLSFFINCCPSSFCGAAAVHRRLSSTTPQNNALFKVSDEVASAMHDGKAVVALESTIITHGMPYPENVRTAVEVETIVRENDAVAATIAVADGRIHVGLTEKDMERLGNETKHLYKISRRDFPVVVSKGGSGGTTVSATMIIAHRVGIPIFVTGGIGGVHRGVETSMDVSADLTELGRTPVAIISAGVKSILDIGKTLEYLETQGVCVATLGPTDDFPAFFSPTSGFKSPCHIKNVDEAACMIDSWSQMGLSSGILIAVPIPESFAAAGNDLEAAISSAVEEARMKDITGRNVTPFILSRVNELTKGSSLKANIALIKNNAAVGSQIAVKLSNRRKGDNAGRNSQGFQQRRYYSTSSRPVVIGGTIVDVYAQFNADNVETHGATYPGRVWQSFGGVARNVADTLSRLGAKPLFISAVGNDSHLKQFQNYCSHMDLSGVSVLDNSSTATHCSVLQTSGEVMYGIGDMAIHQQITPQLISKFTDSIVSAPLVCMDGNITIETIEYITDLCFKNGVPVWFEPTDVHKATKPFQSKAFSELTFISPNIGELHQMCTKHKHIPDIPLPDFSSVDMLLSFCQQCIVELLPIIPVIVVTLGRHGVMLGQRIESLSSSKTRPLTERVSINRYPACTISHDSIVSVSGAGDCLAGTMMKGIIEGQNLDQCVQAGLHAAYLSLQSRHPVPVFDVKEN